MPEVVDSWWTREPHVLADAKNPYVFPLIVVVGDGEPVPVDDGSPCRWTCRSMRPATCTLHWSLVCRVAG